MSEPEVIKKALKETFNELKEDSEEMPSFVQQSKENIEKRSAAEKVSNELLEKVMPIVDSRRKLQEAEQDVARSLEVLREILTNLSGKIDAVSELKQENLMLERKVLMDIEAAVKKEK